MSLHCADSKCQISHRWSKNGSECTSLCAPKVIQEVNFQKSFFEDLYTGWIVVVHLYVSVFLCGFRWRHNRAPNLEPRFLVNFVPVWGRIASPIMHRFGHCLRHLLQDQTCFVTHLTIHRSVCRWRHKIRKIAFEILQGVNKQTQSLREIAYYAW